MKKISLALFALFLSFADLAPAQTAKHRIVMQMNVDGPDSWSQLLGNIRNVQKSFSGDTMQIEVVAHGKGLALLLKTNAKFAEEMKQASDTGVVFAACQNSMRTRNVKPEDLIPFATQVDSGVAEIIRKQEAGWSYLRAGE